jgi:HEAT repeat protein
MHISLKCSACGKALKVAHELAGRKVRCPGCKGIVAVPPLATVVVPTEPASVAPASSSPQPSSGPPAAPSSVPVPRQGFSWKKTVVAATVAAAVIALVGGLVWWWQAHERTRLLAPWVAKLNNPQREQKVEALVQLAKMGPDASGALKIIGEVANTPNDKPLAELAAASRYMIDPTDRYMDRTTSAMNWVLGDEETFPGLVQMAHRNDAELRAAVLPAMSWYLIRSLAVGASVRASGITIVVTDPDYSVAIQILESNLKHPNAAVRRAAAMGLAALGMYRQNLPAMAGANDSLTEAVKDPDQVVRGLAKMALGLGGQTDVDTKAAADEFKRRSKRFVN